jgi:hypothetical protein
MVPDVTVEHGFVHDRDEADRHRTPLDGLLLQVDAGGDPIVDQIVGGPRPDVQRAGVVRNLE